jgi:hypothetical protein
VNAHAGKVAAGKLISDDYRAQQEHLHETTAYGTASIGYAPLVQQIINRLEISHLLDYGCGKGMNLIKHLKGIQQKLTYQGYDPGVPELADAPVPAQMVACIDVLEHIEPECLDNVLDHIASLTEAVAFLSIHTGPALKKLPDGRNAHLIQEPAEWWLPKLMSRWDMQTIQRTSDKGFYFIGYAKPRIEAADGSKLI